MIFSFLPKINFLVWEKKTNLARIWQNFCKIFQGNASTCQNLVNLFFFRISCKILARFVFLSEAGLILLTGHEQSCVVLRCTASQARTRLGPGRNAAQCKRLWGPGGYRGVSTIGTPGRRWLIQSDVTVELPKHRQPSVPCGYHFDPYTAWKDMWPKHL